MQDLDIFLRYVKSKAEQIKREEVYRLMMTESLRILPEGKCITKPYLELLKPQEVDTRTGEQVAEEVAKKMGTKVDWGR